MAALYVMTFGLHMGLRHPEESFRVSALLLVFPVGADGRVVRDDVGPHLGLQLPKYKIQSHGSRRASPAGMDGGMVCDDVELLKANCDGVQAKHGS